MPPTFSDMEDTYSNILLEIVNGGIYLSINLSYLAYYLAYYLVYYIVFLQLLQDNPPV